MKVEIWSDYACPFCYIGKRRFEGALNQFAHKEEVEVIFRSFELDPHAEKDVQINMDQLLAAKYGMSLEQAKAANDNVTRQAAEVGLAYHMDTVVPTNTFDAHRLTHFAEKHGKMGEMSERLFRAFFTESKHLGDRDMLSKLAAEVGLSQEDVLAMLDSDDYVQGVRADENEATQLGVRGVPFFVINRKYAVSGAQPHEVFVEALQKAWEEDRPLTIVNNTANRDSEDAYCADGTCEIPKQK